MILLSSVCILLVILKKVGCKTLKYLWKLEQKATRVLDFALVTTGISE